MTTPDDPISGLLKPHPLGNVWRSSGRIGQEGWFSAYGGAENLLEKAKRALIGGDGPRADAMIRRAAGIPFDPHGEQLPGAAAAGMMLFGLVTDVAEDSSEDDSTWLEAALIVLDETTGPGRDELQHVLAVMAAEYDLARAELAVVRKAIADRDRDYVPLIALTEAPIDLVDRMRAVLQTCIAYQEALAEPG
jgi:hypothetical protein